MPEEIKVHVIDYGRKNLYMRYADPVTGKHVAKSTGTHLKREAERAAAKWEAELREGRYKAPSKITWEEFTERHASEVQAGFALKTAKQYWTIFQSVSDTIGPKRLIDLTAERISRWQQALRERELSEVTIKNYSAHLKASLTWAVKVGMLGKVPEFVMPKRAKRGKLAKGRAVTGEELERMLKKTRKVVGDDRAEDWKHFLHGLWWSGLRLGEAVGLTWDGDGLRVEFIGGDPMLAIPGDCQKSGVSQLLPIAPEFAEMLLAVPEKERTGFVFNLPMERNTGARRVDTVGKVVSEIGQKANIVVNRGKRAGNELTKFASAHDLRRAFGTRWAPKLMPADLQQLMRHSSISTTMEFYVTKDAQELTARLKLASGNTPGNTSQKSTEQEDTDETQVVEAE